MTGQITRISGPTIHTDLTGLALFERVFVGEQELTGEVVRLYKGGAVIQVYEPTIGLAKHEPVRGSGSPLTVTLGPGMIGAMYDGLQRPLQRLMDYMGPFMANKADPDLLFPLFTAGELTFTPACHAGEEVAPHAMLGNVSDGRFDFPLFAPTTGELRVQEVAKGDIAYQQQLIRFADGRGVSCHHEWPVRIPRPIKQKLSPSKPLVTGQRVVDFLFPLVKGGVCMIPGGFGTGKTIFEQSVAKFADVDVVIYVGCGERGNEMAELLEEFRALNDPRTQRTLMERTVMIVNTSNMPVAAREASIYTAVTIAEYFRDLGLHVLLLADSLSRWAEALREISTSLEEIPGEEGYPTYLASRLATFVERAGLVQTLGGKRGSLSMVLSVSPPGGDVTEPVTQALLRSAGVYLMLDSSLAQRRHFPAINWNHSYSLYADKVSHHFSTTLDAQWNTLRHQCREMLREEEALRDVAEIVGVEGLQDRDRLVIHSAERIRENLLVQNAYSEDAFSAPARTLKLAEEIIHFHQQAMSQLDTGALLDDLMQEGASHATE